MGLKGQSRLPLCPLPAGWPWLLCLSSVRFFRKGRAGSLPSKTTGRLLGPRGPCRAYHRRASDDDGDKDQGVDTWKVTRWLTTSGSVCNAFPKSGTCLVQGTVVH